jgi:hypothetical protein
VLAEVDLFEVPGLSFDPGTLDVVQVACSGLALDHDLLEACSLCGNLGWRWWAPWLLALAALVVVVVLLAVSR